MRPRVLVAWALSAGIACAAGAGSEPLRLGEAEAIARAREASPRQASLADLERAAEASLSGARAERMPSFEWTGGYTRLSDVPEVSLASPGTPPRTIFPNLPDNWRTRFAVSVPVYTGGRIGHAVDARTFEREAATADLRSGEGNMVLETSIAYWTLVTARESERSLGDALASYDAHLKAARDREDVGLSARNEVLAVEAERARAELGSLKARNEAAIANRNLVRLLDFAPGTTIEPTADIDLPPAIGDPLETLVAEALAARPERRALTELAAAAEAVSGGERARRYPQASVAAGWDYANPNRRILPPDASFRNAWDVSLNLSWLLFDGGRTDAAAAAAAARASALRHQLEDLEGRIRFEVEARLLDLDTARAQGRVADRGVESAEESLRVARDRYHEGLIASAELLDAETALLHAHLDRVEAQAGAHLARAGLDRALGR